jgi:glutathione synthase/RimK-type ligase-like ATP-grasp enzyme
VAAAVDLRTGRTFGGVCRDRAVSAHPDTRRPVAGVQVPSWPRVIDAAMKLAEALEMGYVGVDFVLDAQLGPVVLEANARPGLAIQIANRQGLLPRLAYIDSAGPGELTRQRRMELLDSLPGLG